MLYFNLSNGLRMPALGLGTWQATTETMEKALDHALRIGYRHIDTAILYENEQAIGNVLHRWLTSGRVNRKDLFITTKLPPTGMYPGKVDGFLQKSLENLRLDYVDLYLVHSPEGIREIPENREDVVMDASVDHVAVWKKLEEQVKFGRTKSIGLSNFNINQIENLLKTAQIKPVNLQIELHLFLQQKEIVDYCKRNSITVVAYSPLGSPGIENFYKEYGRDIQVPKPIEHPLVKQIAEKYRKTPAQILLRHILQRGVGVIPKSSNPSRLQENFNVFDFNLDEDTVKVLNELDVGPNAKVGRWEPWTWV